jgi:uncharacterized repeat protein (TIGR03806 family)
MKKNIFILFLLLVGFSIIIACNNDNETVTEEPITSPVNVDLTQVPFPKLSDYKFFSGALKNLTPEVGVLPYKLESELFTDYASKKRFVWLPAGTKATFNGNNEILELPTGAAIIKVFYYQKTLPSGMQKIMETRLMIKKQTGWIFAEYVWNDAQTEAFLQPNGSNVSINFEENGVAKTANYRFPSNTECLICHKENSTPYPIGIKPQNLNSLLNYGNGNENQLQKWINVGYLENNMPNNIVSTVDYKDTTKPLDLRLRSYLDINCAHCHREGSHCDYRPIRLGFSETTSLSNLGVCVDPQENIDPALTKIIVPSNKTRSVMYYRLNATNENVRMPLLGRSIVHEEGVALLEQYINTLTTPCN